jgi:hypothetical protein
MAGAPLTIELDARDLAERDHGAVHAVGTSTSRAIAFRVGAQFAAGSAPSRRSARAPRRWSSPSRHPARCRSRPATRRRQAVARQLRRGRARCRGSSRRSRARRRRCWCPARLDHGLDLARHRSISSRSLPKTLIPIGVRMPVDSMSMRALIGMVHALATPGNCSAASSSAISVSVVMPGRHSDCGLRLITVSNISSRRGIGRGVGAAGLADRPRPPPGSS